MLSIQSLSYSAISSYLNCPLQFRYHYVDHVEPEHKPLSLVYGSALHKALEGLLRSWQDKATLPLQPETYRQFILNSLKEDGIHFQTEDKDQERQALVDQAMELLNLFNADPFWKATQIVATEQEFSVPVDGFDLIGRLDVVVEKVNSETGEIRPTIIDFKSMAKRMSEAEVAGHAQMTAYSFSQPQADLGIYGLIKTKKPGTCYWPTSRSDYQRNRFRKTAIAVKQAIEREVFYPQDSWMCGSCPYANRCKKDY